MDIRQYISRATTAIERHPNIAMAVTLLFTSLYLLPVVVTGVDVCDTGFYLVFYQNFFSSPDVVNYNFMYYMSGLIGGSIYWVMPSMGLLGWKIIGLLTLVASQWIAFLSLRRVISVPAIMLGNVPVVFSYVGLPIALCNDLVTALFYSLAIGLLHSGSIGGGNRWKCLLAGVVLGLNIFTRIPNVLACVLVLAPLLAFRGKSARSVWMLVASSVAGVFLATGAMILLMLSLGHFELFINNLKELMFIAGDEAGGSTHAFTSMIRKYLDFYGLEVILLYELLPIVIIYEYRHKLPKLSYLIAVASMAVVVYVTWDMKGYDVKAFNVVWLFSFATCCWLLVTRSERSFRLMLLLALAMMLIFPLGSDGAYNNGSIIALFAAPVAALWWVKKRRWLLLLPWLAVCSIQMSLMGAYFDGGSLLKKTSPVQSERLRGVYTTPARADVFNQMIDGIDDFVSAGDTLLAYGSFPMINFVTDTRPAMGCSWPELLGTPLLRQKLGCMSQAPKWILRQHFNTLHKDWGEPTDDWATHYYPGFSPLLDDAKLKVMSDFMQREGYVEVWSNTHFTLYGKTDGRLP